MNKVRINRLINYQLLIRPVYIYTSTILVPEQFFIYVGGRFPKTKKAANSMRASGLAICDPDEIRTRDLLRDRQAF